MRLAVTIDTEADAQWEPGVPIATKNVTFWAPFHDLCMRHGVTPTYLVTTEIVEDDRARDLLSRWSEDGVVEVGAHLHPWTTPPFVDRPGLRYNDLQHAFPSQLPDELLREKTAHLTAQIEAAFGSRPLAFRAGRFGMDARLAGVLADEGYLVDSSVTPLWSWRSWQGMDGEGGPDFRRHPPQPFTIFGSGANGAGLLEIPITLFATYAVFRRWPALLGAYRCLPVRATRSVFLSRWLSPQPVWLTPDPRYSDADLQAVWDCAARAGLDATVMLFHSSELMPGASPFRPDTASVSDLLGSLDRFFAYVRDHGGEFATLTELASAILSGPPPQVKRL